MCIQNTYMHPPPSLSLSIYIYRYILSLLKKFLDPRIIKSLCVHLKRHLVHCPIAIIPIFINVLYKISSKILCEAEEQIIIIVHIWDDCLKDMKKLSIFITICQIKGTIKSMDRARWSTFFKFNQLLTFYNNFYEKSNP